MNHLHHRPHAHRAHRGLYPMIFVLLHSGVEAMPQKFKAMLVEAVVIFDAIHTDQHIVNHRDCMLQLRAIRSAFLIKKRDAAMRYVAAAMIEITLPRLSPRIHKKINDKNQMMISGIVPFCGLRTTAKRSHLCS